MLRIVAIAAACVAFAQPAPGPITVSAAVSLTEALEEIAKAYAAAGGGRVAFNFAGSNVLARQVVNGAPVDLFISADAAQMQLVERAGHVSRGGVVPLVANELAIVVRHDRGTPPAAPAQVLADPGVRRIAMGDPEAVPAGVYAKQYLERAGLWKSVEAKLVPFPNVRAALAAVEHGGADAGIVYATEARIRRRVRVAAVISGPDAPAIVYPAAVVATSRGADAAARFLAFLQTAEATRIFERHGFRTPAPRP